jgi:hypothetical protein
MTIASLDLLRAILRKTAAQSALLMAIGVYVGVWNVRVFADEKDDFFESKIRPILVQRCEGCHTSDKGKMHGGLALDTKLGWTIGGDSGPAIVPGKPMESLIIAAIEYGEDGPQMPPSEAGGKLPNAEIQLLKDWIGRGAHDPRIAKQKVGGMDEAEAKSWWAFQPLQKLENFDTATIDSFIESKLTAANLSNAPEADKRTLLRRATYDLTGLPPTSTEMSEFLADTSADAFSRIVERLLASPHYGERWGRHWLDLARYADSWDARSYGGAGDIAEAWRYRDWVVNAFNRDQPYDQFVRDQIAGDILGTSDGQFNVEQIIATGAYAIGEWGNGDADKKKIHTDIVDDQVDFTSRTFLGITLACARCHDHKYDPFTTREYHALAGFFYSSRILENFTPPGAGEEPMRIDLTEPHVREQQMQKQKRIAEIDTSLMAMLRPLQTVERNALGTNGLMRRIKQGADTPSLMFNETDAELKVLTFRIPPIGVAIHPGPTSSVTAAWISPAEGIYQANIKLVDTDPNCGDGVLWELRHGTMLLGSGAIANGGTAEFDKADISIAPGELLRLIIKPQASHACDTTVTEFVITRSSASEPQHWSLGESLKAGRQPGEDGWWVCEGDGQQLIQNDATARTLEAERAQLTSEMIVALKAVGLAEGGIKNTTYAGYHNARIHKRGQYDQLSDEVPRGFPVLLANEQPKIVEGSGRLELAKWVISPGNPLTARVMVNRIWQHHFGQALVRTPNNFGKLGERPTHPELLDYLAAKFIENGWSIKQMHRLVMNSDAYKRSSVPSSNAGTVDIENTLISHQQRRRLSAEELRDSLLFAAGSLDPTRGGPAVRDLMVPRRTLYIANVRSDRSGYLAVFDGANAQTIVDKRNDTVVAPQALWLLNNTFALTQANALASLVVKQDGDSNQRLAWLTDRLFQRPPTKSEQALVSAAVDNSNLLESWEPLCHVLLCTNEFVYVD